MCLLLLALHRVPERPWLLLGNRDEFHARPTAAAAHWLDAPAIAGGRDLEAGGSWLAVHHDGRYAAVTNVRAGMPGRAPRSRGELVGDFVRGLASPADYLADIAARRTEYGPFNLIVGDPGGAGAVSSLDGRPRLLGAGVHAFSNGSPDDEWPKMQRLRTRFDAALAAHGRDAVQSDATLRDLDSRLLDLLFDTHQPDEHTLPDTGVGADLERHLAPVFILPMTTRQGGAYGTRASTIAYASPAGLVLRERRYDDQARLSGETRVVV